MVRGEPESFLSSSEGKQRLEERIEEVEDDLEGERHKERFLEVASELQENFGEYGDALYHGTWGESADNIMENGIRSVPGETPAAGETGAKGQVSLTYLPSWAFHYSVDQSPNTVKTVRNFVNRNYDIQVESREELRDFVDSLDPRNTQDEGERYNARILKEQAQKTEGFRDMREDISDILVHGVVFGLPLEAVQDQVSLQNIPTRNTMRAIEEDTMSSLGEVKVNHVDREDLTAYVPHEFLDLSQDEHSKEPVDVKSYDSLMLYHELQMEDFYRENGVIDLGGFWEGERLGVSQREKDWNPKPYVVDITM